MTAPATTADGVYALLADGTTVQIRLRRLRTGPPASPHCATC
jgi:hypothetical protein